jgi:phenylalanyl-tRNA synthetase alpha subunit
MDIISVLLIEHGIPTQLHLFFKIEEAEECIKTLVHKRGLQYNKDLFAYIEPSFEVHLMFSKLKI